MKLIKKIDPIYLKKGAKIIGLFPLNSLGNFKKKIKGS